MHTNQGRYNWVQLYLIQSLVLLTDINKASVDVIIAHPVTVSNFVQATMKPLTIVTLYVSFPQTLFISSGPKNCLYQ